MIALYAHSQSAGFVHDIRALLAAGFRELGHEISLRDELSGLGTPADWHVVVVPDEFFFFGAVPLASLALPERLILVNTEQRGSSWFQRAEPAFRRALVVWDIDLDNAMSLVESGVFADFLALGFADEIHGEGRAPALPLPPPLELGLDPDLWAGHRVSPDLADRPIDLFFAGRPTPRRLEFFAENAERLSRFRNFFFFSDALSPRHGGTVRHEHIAALAGQARIILNIHGEEHDYFEWHRIVQFGMANRSLVLSETCGLNPWFHPGAHYLEAPLHKLAARAAQLLDTECGREQARTVANAAWNRLSRECRMSDTLRPLMERAEQAARATA